MEAFICATCGTQFPPSDEPPAGCPIRLDERQYVGRLGGHFDGGTVCLWSSGADGRGALLSGDIVQVVADRDRVSFMYSYPNLIPLPASELDRIRAVVETLEFDRVYGAWWTTIVADDAKAKVLRSADRYLAALAG